MNGLAPAFVNTAAVSLKGAGQRPLGFSGVTAVSGSNHRLTAIQSTDAKVGVQRLHAQMPETLRLGATKHLETRCFAHPPRDGIGQGAMDDQPEASPAADLGKQLTDQQFSEQVASTKESGGLGNLFIKPFQAMSHSLKNQFEAFIHHKPELPKELAPEYGRAMANHLPMALSALRQLGASPEICAQFEADYCKRTPLRDISDQKKHLDGDPARVLGRRDYYLALRDTFKAYQAAHGTDALLNLWVPKLTEGLSASAFHAVIRLGYALSDQNTDEIVNALAFWASAYQSLGTLDGYRAENPIGDATITPIFEKVAADPDLGHQTLTGQGIANRLGRVARLPGYERLVEMINQSGKFSLADLREQSLNLFLHQPSFTTLHLVTGAEGLAKASEKVSAPQSLLQHYALALTNVYISRGTPALTDTDKIKSFVRDNDLPDWSYLKSEAIASGDEHKIKFVQTCESEFEKTGDSRYQLAAGVWMSGKQPWLNA